MSFPRYPKYKPSGVEWLGEMPEHWEAVTGRRVFAQVREPSRPEDDQLSATQKYGVIPQRRFMELEDQKVALALSGVGGFQHVEANDFVISLRSFQGGIERSQHDGCVSPAYTVLRARVPTWPPYWALLLKSAGYVSALQSRTDGIRDGKAINYGQFSGVAVPLPPLEEQRAIAAFLDRETAKIDALVAEQERLIELLKEKRQAVISHAVTKGLDPTAPMKPSGIEWLGDVPAHWEIGPLKRFWSITDCKHVTAEFVEDGYPLASIREVQGKWVALEDAKRTTTPFFELLISGGRRPEAGDLIFSRNATVGEVAQVRADHPPFAMGQDVVLLRRRSPASAPDYLQAAIRSAAFAAQLEVLMIGSTFRRINVQEIGQCWIPWPPSQEQDHIAAYIERATRRFDRLVIEAEGAIRLFQERRSALISAAVTGQIDVRDAVPVEVA